MCPQLETGRTCVLLWSTHLTIFGEFEGEFSCLTIIITFFNSFCSAALRGEELSGERERAAGESHDAEDTEEEEGEDEEDEDRDDEDEEEDIEGEGESGSGPSSIFNSNSACWLSLLSCASSEKNH